MPKRRAVSGVMLATAWDFQGLLFVSFLPGSWWRQRPPGSLPGRVWQRCDSIRYRFLCPKSNKVRRAGNVCPSSALVLVPFYLALPLLLSFTDPILGLNMGYFSDIQTLEGDDFF